MKMKFVLSPKYRSKVIHIIQNGDEVVFILNKHLDLNEVKLPDVIKYEGTEYILDELTWVGKYTSALIGHKIKCNSNKLLEPIYEQGYAICPLCNKEVYPKNKICTNCGQKLNWNKGE